MISVLLVDDDPALLEIARIYLGKNKRKKIDTAQSTEEALEKLKKGTYDVIVSDYDMPGMTGIDFLKRIRSSGDLTPFIIFTGKGQEQVAMEAINNGADFYLVRAGDPKNEFPDLIHKIQKAVLQRRADITIKESEEHLRKLLHSLPSGVLVIDADTHTILQANPAALHMMGAKEHDIKGKSCFGLICPIEKGQCPITDLSQKLDSIEQVLLRKNGTAIPVIKNVIMSTFGDRKVLVESFIDLTGLNKVERELFASNEKYRHLIEKSNEAIVVAQEGMSRLVNPKVIEFTGYSEEELLSTPFLMFIHPDDRAMVMERYQKRLTGEEAPSRYAFRLIPKNGITRWVDLSVSPIEWDGHPATLNFLSDITERKQAEHRQYLAAEILGILNDPSSMADSINLILAAIKRETGFDAVGIRMRIGDDFPYIVQDGFSCDFLRKENLLVAHDASGTPYQDENGKLLLECTCGLVISGKTDPLNPLFTKSGSCWSNNSRDLLDLLPGQDPRFHPRNTCIHQGFLSIAFIPIRANREIIGLLQLNDRKPDCFTLEMIHFFEGIGSSIGIALMRKQEEERLLELSDRLSLATKAGGVGIWDLDLVNNVLTWDDQMFTLYGTTREQFGGAYEAWQAGLHPDDRERGDAEIQMALRGEKEFDTEFRVIKPDGSIRNIRALALVQCDPSGKPLRMIGTNWDITAQKNADAALRESEVRFNQLAEKSRTIVWEVDTEGLYTYVSHVSDIVLGYCPDELVGRMHFYDLHPEQGREEFRSACFADFERKEHFNDLENVIKARDGRNVWVSTHGIPLLNADGTLRGYRGSDTDITDRKNVEEALRESEEKYRLLVENSHDIIFTLTVDGVFIFVSPAWTVLLGHPVTQVTGLSFQKFVHPDDMLKCQEFLQSVLKTGRRQDGIEYRVQHTDGTWYWHTTSAVPLKDEDNAVVGFSGIARDITQRKMANDEIKRIKVAIDATGDAIVMSTAEGCHFYQNAAFERLFGYTLEEVSRLMPTKLYVNEEDTQKVFQTIMAGKSWHGEVDMIAKNGRCFPVSIRADAVKNENGNIIGLVGVHQDISERRQAEKILHESREKYQTLVEEIHDTIWLIDANGRFKYVSPRSSTLLGYQPEEMIGHLISEYISFEDASNVHDVFEKNLMEHKELHLIETHTRRKDGGLIILESSAIPYYSKNGTILGYRGVSRDITEIKKIEAVKSLLAAIVTSSEDAIVGEDLHHIVTTWNKGAELMYGYSMEEMIGTDSYRIVPDVEKGALYDIIPQVLKGGHVEHFNTFRIKKDGTLIEVSMSLSPILDEKGQIVGIAKIARDLTKQRETEKALLAYISETAMRLKNPVELIGGRLSEIQKQVLAGDVTPDELFLQLQIQIKNTEQIVSNLRDLNRAISVGLPTIPEAYRNYLER